MVDISKDEFEQFQARYLRLTGLPGLVQVKPVEGLQLLRVGFEGSPEQVRQVRREVIRETLHVAGLQSGTTVFSTGTAMTVIGNMSGSVINYGNGVVVAGNHYGTIIGGHAVASPPPHPPGPMLKTVVEVPLHTPVTVQDTGAYSYDIGDILADVELSITGGHVTVGRVASASVELRGNGTVLIDEIIAPTCRCQINGHGHIAIAAGTAERFTAQINGTGRIGFKGVAERASLVINGSGDIRVDRVTERVERQVNGSGSCEVRVPPATNSNSFWGF